MYKVPSGHVAVVKQLTAYANSTVAAIEIFFHSKPQNVAVWHHHVEGLTASFGSHEGTLTFEEGAEFAFYVDAAPVDGADCYAGGYLLTIPSFVS